MEIFLDEFFGENSGGSTVDIPGKVSGRTLEEILESIPGELPYGIIEEMTGNVLG